MTKPNECVYLCGKDKNLISFCEECLDEFEKIAHNQAIEQAMEAMGEEIEIGDETYCRTCGGHMAAGECDCIGKNKHRAESLEKLKRLKI